MYSKPVNKNLKLDLHTHCKEATGLVSPDFSLAQKIVTAIKTRGLDGIAITDHAELGIDFAYQIKDIISSSFTEEIIIIPGLEFHQGKDHIVELYLPDNLVFRFLAHPGSSIGPWEESPDGLHGLEIDNGAYYVDRDRVLRLAQRYDLLLLSNSDAHSLTDIGLHYTEISLEELKARAKRGVITRDSAE